MNLNNQLIRLYSAIQLFIRFEFSKTHRFKQIKKINFALNSQQIVLIK